MQTKINKQKIVADKVLRKLELVDYHCIIAGGAPRDWYFNKPARDIDVFLHTPQLTTAASRKDILNGLLLLIHLKIGMNYTTAIHMYRNSTIA